MIRSLVKSFIFPASCLQILLFVSSVAAQNQPANIGKPVTRDNQVMRVAYIADSVAKADTNKDASEKRNEVAEQIRVAEIKVKQQEEHEIEKARSEADAAQAQIDSLNLTAHTPAVDTATQPQPTASAGTRPNPTADPATAQTANAVTVAPQPATKPLSNTDQQRLRILKQIDVVLAQQEQQKSSIEDIDKEKKQRLEELASVQEGDIGHDKPWSFLLMDQLQEELATIQSSISNNVANQAIYTDDIVRAKKLVETRQAAKRLEDDSSGATAEEIQTLKTVSLLDIRLAEETLQHRKTRLEILIASGKLFETQKSIGEFKLSAVRSECVFSEADLDGKKDDLKKREEKLRADLKSIEQMLENTDTDWLTDRMNQKSGMQLTDLEREQAELRRYQRQQLQQEVASHNFRLEQLSDSVYAWEKRYCLANHLLDSEDLIVASREAQRIVAQRASDLNNALLRIGELRKTASALDSELEALPDAAEGRALGSLVRRQRTAVRRAMRIVNEEIAVTQACSRVHEKLIDDINGDATRYSVEKIGASVWFHIKTIWNTELTQIDERPITIGKVVSALAIFIGGFWLARFLSRRLRIFTARRLKFDESASSAFESLSFYALLMAAMLSALNFVSIPLTVFTFMGGALAIGVGFGSQNILSNFISGLILLAERPVKVGDLIHLDDFYGNVEHIGARSTLVRTSTNLQLIVPNSKFLENNVINLTHGQTESLRAHVSVGVAYGSKTRDVTKLLKQAAAEHGRIMKKPEPFVLLTEFGDNSIQFELHFWIKVRQIMDQLRVQSDVRYQIDALFNDAGIVISFPQRDVHLNTSGPLNVRLSRARPEEQSIRAA